MIASIAVEAGAGQGREGVVIVESVARASDSPNAPARFSEPLPAGAEVEVMETRERYRRIRLGNDREAWINRGSVALVSEP